MSDSLPSSAPSASAPQAPKAGPSNLRLRVIYGVIGAALLLGSVWFSPWTFGLFFAFVQAVMLWEFYRMMEAGGSKPAVWIGIGAGLAIFATTFIYHVTGLNRVGYGVFAASVGHIKTSGDAFTYSGPNGIQLVTATGLLGYEFAELTNNVVLLMLLLLPTTLLLREMYRWSRKGQSSSPFLNAGISFFGLMYISLPISFLNVLAFDATDSFFASNYDYRRIFALLFLIWASDIGAYAAGKTFGKHKMAPKISPGKTWEGWAGGFLLTLLMGWALGYLLPDMPLTHRLVAASVVAIFAPIGDLAESMLKRSVNVKDSGTIMPGHGGLLDRFDAFLLVLPVLALLQLLAG